MSEYAKSRLQSSDFEILASFRYTLRKFLGFSEKAARAHGVSAQQYQVLLAIEGSQGRNRLTIGELAERMQVTHNSAVGMVDRMQAMNLLQRVPGEQDRRQVWVLLTDKGRKILESLYQVHRRELRLVGPHLIQFLNQAIADDPVQSEEGVRLASPVCYATELDCLEEDH